MVQFAGHGRGHKGHLPNVLQLELVHGMLRAGLLFVLQFALFRDLFCVSKRC